MPSLRIALAGGTENFDPVSVGQMNVDDQEARIEFFDRARRILDGSDRARLAAQVFHRLLETLSSREIVFDDENLQVVASGSWRVASTRSPFWPR